MTETTTDFTATMTDQEMEGLFAALASIGIFLFIVGLILYLLDAFARFKYLKIRAYKAAWMAFIPLVNIYACIDATYGNAEKISVFGIMCPAQVVKLYPIILAVISVITSRISAISTIGSTFVFIANVAFGVLIFKDMLERLGQEISIGFSVLCNIISIVGSIKLISACRGIPAGQFDYTTDLRVLKSQANVS